MIEVMDESSGNILGFRATGKLSQADYRDVLHPSIDEIARFGSHQVGGMVCEGGRGTAHGWQKADLSPR
jgi:hypothetical protein